MTGEYVKRSDALQAVGDVHPLDYNGQGIVERIKAIPAADVRPVVRGKWEMNSNYPDRFICSECGAQFDCWHWEAKQMHYCPSCGAKMDGGQG